MNEEEIKELEVLLKEFGNQEHGWENPIGSHLFWEGEISRVALFFLETQNQCAEAFLRKLLINRDYHFKFLALYAFLKAQRAGIALNKETLEELEKLQNKQNQDSETDILLKCAERKLKLEHPPNSMRR